MILGIDISNYQAGINLAQVKAEGFDFVLAKVTEGATYRNPSWPAFRDQARAAGLLLAGYHYVRTGNPAGEAAACKAWLGDTGIPIMLDWEQNGGDFHNFLAVLNAFRAAGLKVPLGYIPRWYWQQQGSPPLTGFGLGLVSSRYPTASGGTAAAIYRSVTATTWSAYGGLTPTILQFTDRASVAGKQVDANAYLGTRAELAALLGSATPSPIPRVSEEDDLTPDQANQLALLVSQLVVGPDPVGEPWGWPTFGGGTNEKLTVVDYLRRTNQQLQTLAAQVSALETGKTSIAGPAVLTSADLDAIADRVVKLLGAKASA